LPDDGRVFLLRLCLQIVGHALGLIVAAVALTDVSLSARGFLIDVLVFTGVAVMVLPMLERATLRGAHGLAGSSTPVACLIALIVTAMVSDGLHIRGIVNWLGATMIVWAVALLAGLLVPWMIARRAGRRMRTSNAHRDRGDPPNVYRWR